MSGEIYRMLELLRIPTGIIEPGPGLGVGVGSHSALYNAAVAIYDFESGSGTVDTKGNYDLTAVAGATITSANSPPQGSNSGILNGVDERWTVTNAAFNFTGSYSISAWIRIDTALEVNPIIYRKDAVNGHEYELIIQYNTADYEFQSLHMNNWSEDNDWMSTFSPSAATWYHVCFIYDTTANTAVLYVSSAAGTFGDSVNGASVAKTLDPGSNSAALWIGGSDSAFYDGQIDEVVLWGQAITASNAEAIFNKSWR